MKFEYTKEEIARRAFNTGHEELQSEDLLDEDTEIPATDQNRLVWAFELASRIRTRAKAKNSAGAKKSHEIKFHLFSH